MNSNHLAIIVAFYLSKFDKQGLKNLGYKNDSEAFERVGQILGVKKNYIKFRRDEFDPIHSWRKGWQRPMDNRIVRAIEALQNLSEIDLREIVINILTSSEYRQSDEAIRIISLFSEDKNVKKRTTSYILRGPTGRKAEEIFKNYHAKYSKPASGELIDTRDLGCGYDFEIRNTETVYVEVKGLASESGGILFTNKEWETAQKYKGNYTLALVSDIDQYPKVKFISNPTEKLAGKKNIVTTIQIQWSVSATELLQE